jgi:hypothetical protein
MYIYGTYPYLTGNQTDYITKPTKLSKRYFIDRPGNIQKICFGYDFILILADNQIFGLGSNVDGQLGTGGTVKLNKVELILTNLVGIVDDIACGGNYSLIISDGKVYFSGGNLNNFKESVVRQFTPLTNFASVINLNLQFNKIVAYNNNIALVTNQFLFL